MRHSEIARSVELRIEYLKSLNDFCEDDKISAKELMEKIHLNADLILQFDSICGDNEKEFERAIVEIISDSVIMSEFIKN